MEALSWLNRYPEGLDGNRFDQPGMALAYIQNLYQLGASRVEVELSEPEDTQTSTLIVNLPENPAQRQALFDCYRQEAETYGEDFGGEDNWIEFSSTDHGEPVWEEEALVDNGQSSLTFWWD